MLVLYFFLRIANFSFKFPDSANIIVVNKRMNVVQVCLVQISITHTPTTGRGRCRSYLLLSQLFVSSYFDTFLLP